MSFTSHPVQGVRAAALQAVTGMEGAVSLNQPSVRQPGRPLQSIYVLCVMTQQQTFCLQQLNEVVGGGRPEAAGKQLLRQLKEWFGILVEEVQFKDGLGIRQFVFLQVVVETGTRRAKVRYASSCPFTNYY